MTPIFTLLAVMGAAVAGYTDFKHGIIPNRLTLSLFTIGFLGHLLLEGRTIAFTLFSGVVLMFVLGYGFWFLGGWSAGDAKEFLFLAALLPIYPLELRSYFNPALAPYPFVLTIFVNTFLAIFPFIFIWGVYLYFKKAELNSLITPFKESREIAVNAVILTAAVVLTSLLGLNALFAIPIILISLKLGERLKLLLSLSIMPLFLLLKGDLIFIGRYFAFLFLGILTFKLFWNAIKIVRKEALVKDVGVNELEEGMVLSEAIYSGDDKIDNKARGLSMDEIESIRKIKGKEIIRVKRTIPFAPVIFIGLLISLAFGDLTLVMRNG